MLRLKNLEDWKRVDVGKKLILPSEDERKVRLEVSVSVSTVLTIASSCGKRPKFECLVSGYEVLEFVACGQYEVSGDHPFYCHTVEGEQVHIEHHAETFTELKTRRARNRELEEIVARANRNSEIRMQRLLAEQEVRFRQLQEEDKSDESKRASDSGSDGEGAESAADGSTSASDKGPASDSAATEEKSEPASG